MKFLPAFSLIFILMAFCQASTQQQFTLPNLGINGDSPTCDNVDALITAAQNDQARLSNFVKNDVAAASNNVQSAAASVQQVCNAQLNIQSSSLLQAQVSSKGRSVSKLTKALEKAYKKLASKEGKNQLYTDLIGPKIDDLSEVFLQFTQNVTAQSSFDFNSECAELEADLQELSSYLSFLSTQITNQVLGLDLPGRVSSLNTVKAACDAMPVTQSGIYRTNFYQTNDPMQQPNRQDKRVSQATIAFNQPFAYLPTVGIALYGIDVDKGTPNIRVDVINVTKTGFTVQYTAAPLIRFYNGDISYFATVSSKSGIYIITDDADVTTDAAMKSKIQGSNSGMRTYTKALNVPAVLPNAKSAVFVRGFNFNSGNNLRLDVTSDATTVSYSVWDNSVLNAVGATILYWSGSDNSVVVQNAKSTYNGPMTNKPNSGTRGEQRTLSTANYLAAPEKIFGFTHLDYGSSANYRLDQTLTGTNSQWTLGFTTWSDTILYQTFDTIVFACTLSDHSKCVKSA